jgi:hypothetical protein
MLGRAKTTTPVWCVAFSFVLTVAMARWVSYLKPAFHYTFRGMHIHHYMYGIFMLTIAGYLGLTFKGPKATFWIALLYGWGAGFTFDEMGMWLNSSVDQSLRWDNDGVVLGILALLVLGLYAVRARRQLDVPRTQPEIFAGRIAREGSQLDKPTIDALAVNPEE